ncbi:MAG: lysozyme inhibitor LprI family protein [Zoogloeaceae bacterium]|jgi:uncharacterized protein|nr:lysozyme inhibitor LprI family protein [Zoogloeaceae bacterium]
MCNFSLPKRLFQTALVASLLSPLSVFAASFDYAKAKTPFERAVCANEELSQLDEELDLAYRAALERQSQVETVEELKREQRRWLREHRSEKEASRLLAIYREQIDYLQGLPDFPAPDTPVEPSFSPDEVSETFDFTVRILKPNDPSVMQWDQPSPGQILIRKKGKDEVLQTINLYLYANIPENGKPHTSFVIGDFNFDGHEDFGVQNDGYRFGITYAIFLFDPKSARFQANKAFSKLIENDADAPFTVDPVRKRLQTLYGRDEEYIYKKLSQEIVKGADN